MTQMVERVAKAIAWKIFETQLGEGEESDPGMWKRFEEFYQGQSPRFGVQSAV